MEREGVVAALVARTTGRRAIVAALCGLLVGCGNRNEYVAPPPPEVTIAHPEEREVTTYREFTGHTVAIETVEIRARVQGYLQEIDFQAGARVKEGDLLFVIEPEAYQAEVARVKADLEGKQAQAKAAQQQLEITEAIFARSAGSRTDLVQKTQARDLARAEVAMATANLEAARLNLSYTRIYAPISGRIDRNLVDVGNLVGTGNATVLATIVRDDTIYVYFTASERELLEYRRMQQEGRTAAPAGTRNTAELALATDTGFPYSGVLDYVSNRVDPQTGTIEARATFLNPDGRILPGLFARVRLPFLRERAIVVPQVAVAADQAGPYVLAVGAEDKAEHRRIEVGPVVDGQMQVVLSGVATSDRVIVNGMQRARPGIVVKPTDASPASVSAGPGVAP